MSSEGDTRSAHGDSDVETQCGDDDNQENVLQDAKDESEEAVVVKPKRIVRNPLPKLNEETLKGSRGIAVLPQYFERAKFKGKGHEEEDLGTTMKNFEYWSHRLFPKFPFDTTIERLEKLGSKKAVQTHIKRIRFDLLDDDKPIIDSSDEEAANNNNNQEDESEINQNQVFDSIARPNSPELTADQLEMIKRNQQKARRIRQEKLRKIRTIATKSLEIFNPQPGPSGLQQKISVSACSYEDDDDFEESPKKVDSYRNYDEVKFDFNSTIRGKSLINGVSIKKRSSSSINPPKEDNNRIEETSTKQSEPKNIESPKAIPRNKMKRKIFNIEDNGEYNENNCSASPMKNGLQINNNSNKNMETMETDNTGSELRKYLRIENIEDKENTSYDNIV